MSYMIGLQDTNLTLRDGLKNLMNEREFSEQFRQRWKQSRIDENKSCSIETDNSSLDAVSFGMGDYKYYICVRLI